MRPAVESGPHSADNLGNPSNRPGRRSGADGHDRSDRRRALLRVVGCASGGESAAVGGDQDALVASGATSCVAHDSDSALVRAEYDCDGGLTLTTYKSPLLRAAMASVTG